MGSNKSKSLSNLSLFKSERHQIMPDKYLNSLDFTHQSRHGSYYFTDFTMVSLIGYSEAVKEFIDDVKVEKYYWFKEHNYNSGEGDHAFVILKCKLSPQEKKIFP